MVALLSALRQLLKKKRRDILTSVCDKSTPKRRGAFHRTRKKKIIGTLFLLLYSFIEEAIQGARVHPITFNRRRLLFLLLL